MAKTNGNTPVITEGDTQDETSKPITIIRLARRSIIVPIVGLTPLIVHRFDEKARKIMLDKMMQGDKATTKAKKDPKDPHAEFMASRYFMADGGDGFPATGFKAAMVDSARFFGKDVTMVQLRQVLYVRGEGAAQLVAIAGDCTMREDAVKVGMGGTDLRYRGMFAEWSAALEVSFLESQIDVNSVVNLVDAAGNGGVGEWRPSSPKGKTGTYGQFAVDISAMVGVIG
jgi:3D (Asp-Asp-Asp) domain-containing protein